MLRLRLLLIAFALVACAQPADEPVPSPDPIPALQSGALGEQVTAAGRIDSWPAGTTATIQLAAQADPIGTVEADGRWSFTLTKPLSPPLGNTISAGDYFGVSSSDELDQPCAVATIQVIPADAKINIVRSVNGVLIFGAAMRAQWSPEPLFPSLIRQQYDPASKRTRAVSLVYAEQSVRIEGQWVCRTYAPLTDDYVPPKPGGPFYYVTLSINLSLKPGWNEVLQTYQEVFRGDTLTQARSVIVGGAGNPPIPWAYSGLR